MFIVKSISLLGAVSLATLGSAAAGDLGAAQEDLFAGGILDLEEAPMSAAQLGEARGGFRFGGMNFNISVDIAPLQIAPLFPNGVFGDSGGPLPNGVFNDGGNGNSSSNNANNQPDNVPSPASSSAQQPSAPSAPAPSAAVTPTAPEGSAAAPVQTAAPAAPAATPPAAPAAPATNPSASAPPSTPAPSDAGASAPVTVVDNSGIAVGGTPSTPAIDVSAPHADQAAPDAPSIPSATSQPSTPTPPAQVAVTGGSLDGSPANHTPSPSNEQQSTPTQTSSAASGGGSGAEPDGANMSMVLTEVGNPEVIRDIGPNGVTTIINNALNNVHITQSVRMDVVVEGYSFATGLSRASTMTTQAVTQSIFLSGLN